MGLHTNRRSVYTMASPLIDRIDALTDFERRSALCFLAGYNAFVLAQALDEMDRQREHLSAFKAMAAGAAANAAQRTDADILFDRPAEQRESLASLTMRNDADLWSLIHEAQQEAEQFDFHRCTECGYDLGTHHPTCIVAPMIDDHTTGL
jgi:hypothetical protein